MNKYLLPYDVFERHKKVASFIGASDTVVDIGGELNHLSQFCKMQKIIVANLNTGDVLITKDKIPFGKKTFDVVCSIDVLEHIPANKRQEFINDLVKIASKKAILSFPIGTPKHVAYERATEQWLIKNGHNVNYLKEHIAYGLPTVAELQAQTKNLKANISYSGNLNINKILFRIFMFDPKIKVIRKLIYFSKLLFNLLFNPILYRFLIDKKFNQNVNRAYVTIDLEKK